MSATLAIVVLQYGGWRDTVACLQSLVPAVRAGGVRVIVVDNASPDDSAVRLQAWMEGRLAADVAQPVHDTVAAHWWPLRGADDVWQTVDGSRGDESLTSSWALVHASENRGFASGMNDGMRHALRDTGVDAVWLLNNDTVVSPEAASAIRHALDTLPASVGQLGTTVCYYDRPTIVQSVGWCRWNSWLATSNRVHDGASLAQPLSRTANAPGYVCGASWVLRATALRDVGLLSEEGFLYGEELDWSCRAAGTWSTALVEHALVWHREGATVGAGAHTIATRSELADLCAISARLRLSRRFFPHRLPLVYASLLGAALNRLRRGDARRAAAVARLVIAGGDPAPRPPVAPHRTPPL